MEHIAYNFSIESNKVLVYETATFTVSIPVISVLIKFAYITDDPVSYGYLYAENTLSQEDIKFRKFYTSDLLQEAAQMFNRFDGYIGYVYYPGYGILCDVGDIEELAYGKNIGLTISALDKLREDLDNCETFIVNHADYVGSDFQLYWDE